MCVRCAASIEPLNHITDEGEILPDEFSVLVLDVSFSVCLSLCWLVGL